MKNPTGLCMCGCGQETALSKKSRRGYKRGESLAYIRGHSSRSTAPAYHVDDESGCWNWARYIDPIHGYGRRWDGIRVRGAHVVAWEDVHGRPVPAGHDVHHLCGNRRCVNPEHLEVLTRRAHMGKEGRLPYGNPHAKAAKP